MSYLIGIDIGTTHTKAVAFDLAGRVLGSEEISYPAITDQPGYHELDPDVLLKAVFSVLGAVLKTSRQLLSNTGRQGNGNAGGLAGISFSCAMHSLIAVDETGKPLTRAITWADLRSADFADALKGSPAGRRIYQYTGTPIHPMSPLCKLLWLKDRQPALFAKASKFISIKEYIWWHFFGTYKVDHSIASATGLFDIYKLDWYGESLNLAGITTERLSAPVPCTHTETALRGPYRSMGLPLGLPFIIGASDGALANLGSLAVNAGDTALTIGTSGAIRMTTDAPEYDPQERIFNYVLMGKRYVAGGATNNGGGALQWFKERFPAGPGLQPAGPGQFEAAIATADAVPPGCEGLIFLPYLQGERAPVWNADAKGVFFGIRSAHTHAHFLRAVIEGVSYALFQVGISLEETIGPIRHIYASGGFIRSKTWLQMIADIFNRRVMVTNVADASAIGAVILGFSTLGMIEGPEAATGMIRVQETYEPDIHRHEIYRQNMVTYSTLYDRLKDLM